VTGQRLVIVLLGAPPGLLEGSTVDPSRRLPVLRKGAGFVHSVFSGATEDQHRRGTSDHRMYEPGTFPFLRCEVE